MKELILTHQKIAHTTRRIAFQILETYSGESSIIVAGVKGSGMTFAQKIAQELQKISDLEITVVEVLLNKQAVLEETTHLSCSIELVKDQSVVLVDDVLNSGATLMHACIPFLRGQVKKLKTAVLVNRNHKKFPIKADFKGISLSTSSFEHVEVIFEPENDRAYLE